MTNMDIGGLSEYELRRLETISRNELILRNLSLPSLVTPVNKKRKQLSSSQRVEITTEIADCPRRSSRLQSLPAVVDRIEEKGVAQKSVKSSVRPAERDDSYGNTLLAMASGKEVNGNSETLAST